MVEKKAFIIVGLGYGDEGKGLATDYFCLHNRDSIVIRFNGGQQAGHCVVKKNGQSHVFSNFGSGTMRGIPTFWSKFCTFSPTFFREECNLLKNSFKFYIDPNCPITTHYDILFNRTSEITLADLRNGSCGVGFSSTVDRENSGLHLLFSDLLDKQGLVEKLSQIKAYYRHKINHETGFDFDAFDHDIEDSLFFDSILEIENHLLTKRMEVKCEKELFRIMNGKTIIFEGSQGILLDQNFGKWPHITKSNTSSQNAIEMISNYCPDYRTEVIYVTRAYRTRHGAGPFPAQHRDFKLMMNNVNETNKINFYQGKMRYDFLDLNILKDAVEFDNRYSAGSKKTLLVTCIDHLENHTITAFVNNDLHSFPHTQIGKFLEFSVCRILYSFNKCAEYIKDDVTIKHISSVQKKQK